MVIPCDAMLPVPSARRNCNPAEKKVEGDPVSRVKFPNFLVVQPYGRNKHMTKEDQRLVAESSLHHDSAVSL